MITPEHFGFGYVSLRLHRNNVIWYVEITIFSVFYRPTYH